MGINSTARQRRPLHGKPMYKYTLWLNISLATLLYKDLLDQAMIVTHVDSIVPILRWFFPRLKNHWALHF